MSNLHRSNFLHYEPCEPGTLRVEARASLLDPDLDELRKFIVANDENFQNRTKKNGNDTNADLLRRIRRLEFENTSLLEALERLKDDHERMVKYCNKLADFFEATSEVAHK